MLDVKPITNHINMIPEHILNRKGPRSTKDLNPEVIKYLNQGLIQTANLMEWLAVDQLILLEQILDTIGKSEWYDNFYEAVSNQKKPSANSNAKVIGMTFTQLTNDQTIIDYLSNHASDIPRCWAAQYYGTIEMSITERLHTIKPYAADLHFGVREVAIFATKEYIIEELDQAIIILSNWAKDPDENVRRFAVEATRPIGVWTKKIDELKNHPQKGIDILESLKSDTSKYVKDAVGNWLNDASKTRPDWVKRICVQWTENSATKDTAYIVKKALRTINK
ncbi:DNA alkylation repair protein [Aquimarina sp. 2201CG14-23]|uniref:DNA alkylation repair protein n=1 Tax=Aquimarina mycalae TaxID=3040073 RepID=UPI0024781318|nr:DNA alkylation repair protein [Aquimarina sp. 2201CG14-23]MDH7446465.1 DNA alkylation repair protein [Aquimarina sp. 2201CG14-23]